MKNSAESVVLARPHSLAEGSVIGQLAIPRVSLSVMVVEGAGDRDLKLGAGHIQGTSLPGAIGNTAVAAHRDTYFRTLRYIREGDAITLTTLDGEFNYLVKSMEIVRPDDIQVLDATKTETLTLVTCYPFNFIGHAPKRFIVHADRVRPDQTAEPIGLDSLRTQQDSIQLLPVVAPKKAGEAQTF